MTFGAVAKWDSMTYFIGGCQLASTRLLIRRMSNCIFCKILAGEADASVFYRDAFCTAFLTIEPMADGHALVVPNEHYASIFDMPALVAGHMFQVAQMVAKAYGTADVPCEGVNFVMSNGVVASQTVLHAHLHVTPRRRDDGFVWNVPPGYPTVPDRKRLDSIAAKLAKALNAT